MNRRQFILGASATTAVPLLSSCVSMGTVLQAPPNIPLSEFGADSTAEEVTAGLDLTGNVALVTGCNSGIGFETMRVLALRGAHVIGTGRTLKKATDACAAVTGTTTPVELELSDFDSVVRCADAVRALDLPLDMLICNAGYVAGRKQQHAYGVDLTFVINHLGHFILVNRLLSQLRAAQQGRVVMVSSFAAVSQPPVAIEFDNLAFKGNYDFWHSYAHSKLANALFSLELAKRMKDTQVTSNALHPGVIKTNIVRNQAAILRWIFGIYADLFYKDIPQGAATSVYLASHPALQNVSGYFFADCNPVYASKPENNLYNQTMAARLWQLSEELTKDYLS